MENRIERLLKLVIVYQDIFKKLGYVSVTTDQSCPNCKFPEILTLRNEKNIEKRLLRYCKNCGKIVYKD